MFGVEFVVVVLGGGGGRVDVVEGTRRLQREGASGRRAEKPGKRRLLVNTVRELEMLSRWREGSSCCDLGSFSYNVRSGSRSELEESFQPMLGSTMLSTVD